ncbi:MAG TPA: hypothetical protein VFN94_09145 [Nitrospiria bacterium]|nr:hypothetical protein [Nitrospiria bacterium]
MISAITQLPLAVRYSRSEATRTRLIMGGLTVGVAGACLYWSDIEHFFYVILGLQAAILLLYGAQRIAPSISRERADRTWDFQRLTPQSSWDIVLGKLLGAPLYAYFLAAAFIPWLIVAQASDTSVPLDVACRSVGLLATITFGVLAIALMGSAYTERDKTAQAATVGALLSVMGLFTMGGLTFRSAPGNAAFYGFHVSPDALVMFSAVAAGLWALAAAAWRVGLDLLEPRRAWRLPAFMAFFAWYIVGLMRDTPGYEEGAAAMTAVAASLAVLYVAAWSNREGIDDWKRWAAATGSNRLDRAPLWVIGLVTAAGIAAVVAALLPLGSAGRIVLLLPLFAARDLLFLQWCRLTKSRRPDAMATIYLTLVYALPLIVLGSLRVNQAIFVFVPFPDERLGAAINAAPVAAQTALMAWAVARSLAPHLAGAQQSPAA